MSHEIISIDGGSKQYWTDLKEAHWLIARAESYGRIAHDSPRFIGRYIGDDGEMDVEENLAPWDNLNRACKAVADNAMAMRVLEAHGRRLEDL